MKILSIGKCNRFLLFVIFLLMVSGHLSFAQQNLTEGSIDVCILDVRILDGLGSPPERSNILIRGDSISYIGDIDTTSISAKEIIYGQGRYLAPAFIDLHAHGDPLVNVNFHNFLAQGVGTIVLGQDGSGLDHGYNKTTSFRHWLNAAKEVPMDVNIIPFVGHGTARTRYIKGEQATAKELSQIKQYLDQSLSDGAWGLSTGLEYYPGLHADTVELHHLARIVGRHEGMIMSHMRSEDDDKIEDAIEEIINQGEFCAVHISHLKVVYGRGEDRARQILQTLKKAKAKDVQISADIYPYTASYTGIGIVFPTWCKTTEQFEEAKQHRNQELRDYLEKRIMQRNGPEATLFCSGPFTGKTLEEVSVEKNSSYVDILMEMGPQGTSGAYFVMDETLQKVFIQDSSIAFCTDGSPTMWHPRGYGTYAKIIEDYVVEEGLLELPLAVHKMTGLPAHILGLSDRGQIKLGAKADLVLFNPQSVHATATYVNPRSLAEGFDMVWINGQLSWEGQRISQSGKLLLKDGH